ncbi:MAG: tRNA 2-selenouridine(34) synthase MnmH [Gammaproteobacteria bacterium]|nr:tRNA 2-selenouridine(34) synthase MnmH [Gammaproteobacteria bacterium]
MELPQLDDYQALFLADTPLLDVRAPIEFSAGAFPGTTNFPLLNDREREIIGTAYKQQGRESAIALGYSMATAEVQQQRVAPWAKFVAQHPQGALYCFRGGMRSKISQQWIFENTGIVYPRVKGGYKAMRRFLLQEIENCAQNFQITLLSGRTGSGKTMLLQQLKNQIDLEAIYHHLGSAFGNRPLPQPSQIDIENALAIALLKHRINKSSTLILEDESASIGSRKLPDVLFAQMKQAPVVIVNVDIATRVENIFQEYIVTAYQQYQSVFGETQGQQIWANHLFNSLEKIKRRLGGDRYTEVHNLMTQAIANSLQHQQHDDHRACIEYLLTHYYDPMYDYQLQKKQARVVFTGDSSQVVKYLQAL